LNTNFLLPETVVTGKDIISFKEGVDASAMRWKKEERIVASVPYSDRSSFLLPGYVKTL